MKPRQVICTWPDGKTTVVTAPPDDPDFAQFRGWAKQLIDGKTAEEVWPDEDESGRMYRHVMVTRVYGGLLDQDMELVKAGIMPPALAREQGLPVPDFDFPPAVSPGAVLPPGFKRMSAVKYVQSARRAASDVRAQDPDYSQHLERAADAVLRGATKGLGSMVKSLFGRR